MAARGAADILQAALAQFTDASRLYALQADTWPLTELLIERWHGHEALSRDFDLWIDTLANSASLPLDAMIGRRAGLRTRLADSSTAHRTGFIAEAHNLGDDGGLARRRPRLVPWTWFMTQSRRNRLFQKHPLFPTGAAHPRPVTPE